MTDLCSYRVWGAAENKVASDYISKYKPFPVPEDPVLTSKDVSVVVVLLSPPKIFELCLKSWLKNQPRELILVTTFDHCKCSLGAPAAMPTPAFPHERFCPGAYDNSFLVPSASHKADIA